MGLRSTILWTRLLLVGVVGSAAGAACQSAVFSCLNDDDCATDGQRGTCQASTYCSIDDQTCPSGQRYVELAPDNIAGECVPDEGGAETGDETITTTSSSTATTTSSSTTTTSSSSTSTTTSSGPGESTGTTSAVTSPTDSGTTSGTTEGESSSSTGDIDDALVLYMAFEEGALLLDSGPMSLMGECVMSCPTAASGMVGGAATFSETPITVAGIDAVDYPALTVSFWLRVPADATEPTPSPVSWPVREEFDNAFEFQMRTSVPRIHYSQEPLVETVTVAPVVFDEWHHYAATWDGTNIVVFHDGIAVDAAISTEFDSDDHPLYIGSDLDFEMINHPFTGDLDELRIWNRALSQEEIEIVAQAN